MHRSRSRTRMAGGLAAAALAAVSLAAAPAPPPAAAGGIRWGSCPEKPVPADMRCGTLAVPLDYGHPGKGKAQRTVTLALARLPATGPASRRIGSLVLNFGGPGAPGISGLAADPGLFAELNKRYDLVAFDPRGVGHSAPVSCGDGQGDGRSQGRSQGDSPAPATPDGAATELAALRAMAQSCARASGPVLPYIGTVSVARDMDEIRRALGEEKLDFLGFSYGTRLGAVYAAQFPKTTGRMVLDGVDTLSEPLTEQALVSAAGQQRALDNFLTWCAHRPGCVFGTNTRTAKQKVQGLVTRLDQRPLTGGDGQAFTGQDVVEAIGTALYSPRMWPALADALALVERSGDPVGLMQLGGPTEPPPPAPPPPPSPSPSPSPSPDEGEGGGSGATVPGDNTAAALVAVNCADDPDRGDAKASPAAVERELAELAPLFLAASPVFGPRQLMTVLSCYGRPAGTDFIRKIDRPAGIPRMLLVGTRGDPATPYEWTEETAKRLGNTVVVDYKGDGHTGYVASSCVRGYVDHFLLDGRLPSGTRSCPAGE
ncbi:alpha/beta hydrolase [Streptomyces sp. 4.24]|uniref:alpha/beta hydrolase n=1 Tax=Streptomyces tritrimontium TaxID=3406573 RepID=UPI003BB6BFFB